MVQPYSGMLKIITWSHEKLEFGAMLIVVKVSFQYVINWKKQVVK